jgi:hypothetical protein
MLAGCGGGASKVGVVVPSLVHEPLRRAMQQLRTSGLCTHIRLAPTGARYVIVSQSPAPGTRLRSKSSVVVTVGLGLSHSLRTGTVVNALVGNVPQSPKGCPAISAQFPQQSLPMGQDGHLTGK